MFYISILHLIHKGAMNIVKDYVLVHMVIVSTNDFIFHTYS